MKTIKILSLAIIAFAIFGLASSALAATYQYIDAAGNMRSVLANSPEQALATAPNISIHSGVLLYSGTLTYSTSYNGSGVVSNQDTGAVYSVTTYQYINTSGQLQVITANSAEEAFNLSTNIAPHSGVMRVSAYHTGA